MPKRGVNVVSRSFLKRVFSILHVILMLFSKVYGPLLPERDIYERGENKLRVISFNVLCFGAGKNIAKKRVGIATQTIAEYYPDSFGVQEATPFWMTALAANLPEYGFVGVGREDGFLLGEFSAVFYLKDKYEVVDSGTFWLSETPEKPSIGWDASFNRICTWAILENKHTSVQYVHMNTHLDHRGEVARDKSIDLILEKATEFDLPVVFTGDFNIREGSSLYEKMISGILCDSKYIAKDMIESPTFHSFGKKSEIIDYILVNDKIDVEVYRVITEGIDGRYVSDHYPIYIDFELSSKQ